MQVHVNIDPRIESGTTDGQLLFWDNTAKQWKQLETSEAVWDNINKRIGINKDRPTSALDVGGTITGKRMLFGGVHE